MYIKMMSKEGATKIVNFLTPGAARLVQGMAICPIKIFFSTPRHISDKLCR